MVMLLHPEDPSEPIGILIPREQLGAEHMKLLHRSAGKYCFDTRSVVGDRTGLLATLWMHSGGDEDRMERECGNARDRLLDTTRWCARGVETPGWIVKEKHGERIVDAVFMFMMPVEEE